MISRVGLLLALLLAGCTARRPAAPPTLAPNAAPAPFVDVTPAAGIRFRHVTGAEPPLNILETAGAGGALFDANGDGRLDIFLVNGRYLDGRPEQPRHALYRNNGDGTFSDVTARAGLGGGYGMGCAVADTDGDGDRDLYVTHYGRNTLYRNNGDGTFTDVTVRAGVGAGGWSTSAAFADIDGDGDLDLYVARYLHFSPGETREFCDVEGVKVACPPRYYAGQSGILYRNNGDGTFSDITRASGVLHPDGKGLGCIWFDPDDDGDADLYLANDGVANNLYVNDGKGRFTDVALVAGAAYSPAGSAEGSMGVDAGDANGDGRFDLFIGNFQNETDALYVNDADGSLPGDLRFTYATAAAGLADATLPTLTFGVGFLDYDSDGLPDLFAANGHVQDAIARVDPQCTFPQPRQLFRNLGAGRFADVSGAAGPGILAPAVGRGAAFGDWDDDGDVDILVTNNGGPPMLLRNEVGNRRHWLSLRLVGRAPNRDAIGARVRLRAGGKTQVREVRSGGSYASASAPRLHFGLGDHVTVEQIEIRWPGGATTRHRNLPADRQLTLRQP